MGFFILGMWVKCEMAQPVRLERIPLRVRLSPSSHRIIAQLVEAKYLKCLQVWVRIPLILHNNVLQLVDRCHSKRYLYGSNPLIVTYMESCQSGLTYHFAKVASLKGDRRFESSTLRIRKIGRVRFITPVLKTGGCQSPVGSNPTLSAQWGDAQGKPDGL